MKKKIILIFIFLFVTSIAKSQTFPKDSLYGNVKRIREKVIFLTEIENLQLLYYDDYGHSGFMGPESTISRFHDTWYSSNFCYYLNYERFFNPNRKIIKEYWYGKRDDFMNSYRYVYDKKERLISTIDSSEYSIDTRNHYFEEYGDYVDENIIYENLELNIFSHNYKKYKNGKVIRTKNFDDNGTISENINHYNEFGKLDYIIYKNPNTWKKLEGNSHSYGVQDSIGVTYKNLINEYDIRNRLVKTRTFDLDSDKYSNDVIESGQTINIYEGDNLITRFTSNKNDYQTYYNFRYNKSNQLIAKYCCEKDIANAKIIQKYKYKTDIISDLTYEEESFETKKMVKYNISYSYKYDDNKNWTEIIKTVDGVKLYKWIREIEYY
ncbi:hypothetical protein [Flavobacterium sp. ZE23DGlu08]|uniref:hypothetical protein n=1 Tax=Flavobacterium sp. ZE23DGlu08 TaxID=3059026 RepID=UPI00265FCD5C|nr:hypothetical protein [Flavobacterium sp. ZE23DGlu08]WKL43586.1 hypothetical protein Q1W72_14705 [Flavobacterium sp. ZE23DGlu08]